MILIRCPQCKGHTPAVDDEELGRCQWCWQWVRTADERNVSREPEVLRWYVLNDLSSLGHLMYTFGLGQTVIAVTYFWFFFGCYGGANHITELPPLVLLVAIGAVLFLGGVLIIAGGVAVRRVRGRLFAVVGAIFMLTSPLIVGLPIGIWALRKLNRPEVKAAFDTPPI